MNSILKAALFALAISCIGASSALAQSPEAEVLGLRIAKRMITTMELNVALTDQIGKSGSNLNIAKSRPEWNDLLAQAFRDEIAHDQPAFEAMLGRNFVRKMTLEELRAGAEILDDPSMLAAMAASARKAPPPKQELGPKALKIAETPAGRGFIDKLNHFGEIFSSIEDELMVELLPGAFRRFGEAAEAMEAVRGR